MRHPSIVALSCALAFPLTLAAEDAFEQFREEQRESFQDYQDDFRERFQEFQDTFHEELENYRRELESSWTEPEMTDRQQWVEYDENQESRSVVDYDANEIVIDVPGSGQEGLAAAVDRLDELMQRTRSEAYERDEVTQRTLKQVDMGEAADDDSGAEDRVLSEISQEDLEHMVEAAEAEERTEPDGDNGERDVYSLSVPMPETRASDKAQEYFDEVREEADRYDVDPALMLAIMHSESSFNPMARSHIPAYGLMQIVPETAGKDVAQRVYGEPRLLSPDYLYNPDNNIQAGAVYIDILERSYLADIEDPESRLYAVISAYNTGAGNVARTFTGNTNVAEAVEIINDMGPEEVYTTLRRDLPYEETRNYLESVASRHEAYQDF